MIIPVAVSLAISGCTCVEDSALPLPGKTLPGITVPPASIASTGPGQPAGSGRGTSNAEDVVPKPDLVVTDVFLQVETIYYTVRNAGNAASPPTLTYLYVDNRLSVSGSSSYVEPLEPGESKTLSFSQYKWQYLSGVYVPGADAYSGADRLSLYPVWSPEGDYQDPGLDQSKIEVCADARNEAVETNEKNNCMVRVLGILYSRDLLTDGRFAYWVNSSGKRPSAASETSPDGAYIKLSGGGYEMVPEQKPFGWIEGITGYYFSNSISLQMVSYPIRIPAKTSFIASTSLDKRAGSNDGVTFKLGLMDRKGNVVFLPGKTMLAPGTFENWEIDLKDYEGQIVYFILRVEAGNSSDRDFSIWNEARLVQRE